MKEDKEPKETALEKLEKCTNKLQVQFYQDQFGNTVVERGKQIFDIDDPIYKALLAEEYYSEYKDVFNESTFSKHISLGISKAVRKQSKHYPRRIHREGNKIYYDAGKEVWEFERGIHSVYLAEDADCPIIFRRYKDFKEAPVEPTDKSPKELIEKITSQYLHDGLHWTYLASFFEPTHSHPIGLFNGEPGSAKSTLTLFIKDLVDPSIVDKIELPEKSTDFDTYREKFYVCNYDNVRKITAEQADDLCRQVTGSSSVKRKLYTNAGMHLTSGKPRILINGIKPEPSAFNDLLDRLYTVFLRRIQNNRSEQSILSEFNRALPAIRFSCLKLISEAILKEGEDMELSLPRLTQFCVLCEQMNIICGEQKGEFIAHYKKKLTDSHGAGLDDSFAAVLIEYLSQHKNASMKHSALEWYQKIKEWAEEKIMVDDGAGYGKHSPLRPEMESIVKDKDFIKNPVAIGRRFREINHLLDMIGYKVNYIKTNEKNIIEVKLK